MSKRLEKKVLRQKIFSVIQNISWCHPEGTAFETPVPSIFVKVKLNKYDNYAFTPREKLSMVEAKARQFVKDTHTYHSYAIFNRANFSCAAEFEGCETGCVEMLEYYLSRLDKLEALR
jgi:hypothetical protein